MRPSRRWRPRSGPDDTGRSLQANAPVPIELDADLFAVGIDTTTGRVINENIGRIGPGFICATSSGGGNRFDAYAFATIGALPEVELVGPCDLVPVAAQPGAAFFNCKLLVARDTDNGIIGGFASSNSVVNPGDVVPGNPTGSLWTGYIVEDGS